MRQRPEKKKKLSPVMEFFVLPSLLLALIMLLTSMFSPFSQATFVFRVGQDHLADLTNHIKYSVSEQIYVGNNSFDFGPGSRIERSAPPLVYLFGRCVFDFLRCTYPSEQMLLVISTWLITLFSIFLMLLVYHYANGEARQKFLMVIAIFFSGVMLYAMERGTYVLLSSAASMFFLFSLDSEDKKTRELGLISLAAAAGLRMSPAVLGLALVIRRDWKSAFRLAGYGILAVFGPFLLLPGRLANIPIMLENLQHNTSIYFSMDQHPATAQISTTVFGLFPKLFDCMTLLQMQHILYWIAVLAGVAGLVLAFGEKTPWRRAFFLILPIILFPKNSAYYNFLYLLPALVMLGNVPHPTRSEKTMLFLFAVLFTSFQFTFVLGEPPLMFRALVFDFMIAAAIAQSIYNLKHRKTEA